jgi:hypothetical protein
LGKESKEPCSVVLLEETAQCRAFAEELRRSGDDVACAVDLLPGNAACLLHPCQGLLVGKLLQQPHSYSGYSGYCKEQQANINSDQERT